MQFSESVKEILFMIDVITGYLSASTIITPDRRREQFAALGDSRLQRFKSSVFTNLIALALLI